MITIPSKDQKSADNTKNPASVPGQQNQFSIRDLLKLREEKPKIVIISEQCLVYYFKCGRCDMDYVGYINRHLEQHVAEHSAENSSIGNPGLETTC